MTKQSKVFFMFMLILRMRAATRRLYYHVTHTCAISINPTSKYINKYWWIFTQCYLAPIINVCALGLDLQYLWVT